MRRSCRYCACFSINLRKPNSWNHLRINSHCSCSNRWRSTNRRARHGSRNHSWRISDRLPFGWPGHHWRLCLLANRIHRHCYRLSSITQQLAIQISGKKPLENFVSAHFLEVRLADTNNSPNVGKLLK